MNFAYIKTGPREYLETSSGKVEIDWSEYNGALYDGGASLGDPVCPCCDAPLQTILQLKIEEGKKYYNVTAEEVALRESHLPAGFFHADATSAANRGCPVAILEELCEPPQVDSNKSLLWSQTDPLVLHREHKEKINIVFNKIEFCPRQEIIEKNRKGVEAWEQKHPGTIDETINYFWRNLTGRDPTEQDKVEIGKYKALAMTCKGVGEYPWAVPFIVALLMDSKKHPRAAIQPWNDKVPFYRSSYEWGMRWQTSGLSEEEKRAIQEKSGDQYLPLKMVGDEQEYLCLPKYIFRYFRDHKPVEKIMKSGGVPIVTRVSPRLVAGILEKTKRPVFEGRDPFQTAIQAYPAE